MRSSRRLRLLRSRPAFFPAVFSPGRRPCRPARLGAFAPARRSASFPYPRRLREPPPEESSCERAANSLVKPFTPRRSRVAHVVAPAVGTPVRASRFFRASRFSFAVLALWKGSKRERTSASAPFPLFWLGLGEPGGLYRLACARPAFSSMRHPVTLTGWWRSCCPPCFAASGLAPDREAPGLSRPPYWRRRSGNLDARERFCSVASGSLVYEAAPSSRPVRFSAVPPYEATPPCSRRGFETVNGGAFIPAHHPH